MPRIQYHSDALANDFSLFCDDVRRIEAWRELFAHAPPISALTFTPSDPSLEGVLKGARSILSEIHYRTDSAQLWMFLADGPWQDDTRLADYWKIWKRLAREGVLWPKLQRGPEIAVRSPGRVRYATIGLVNGENLDAAMTIAFQIRCLSFMLVSDESLLSESGVRDLFDTAFPRLDDGSPDTYVDWGRLIQMRADLGDVIVKRAGLFDEVAWSVDLFARQEVLLPLFEHVPHRQG